MLNCYFPKKIEVINYLFFQFLGSFLSNIECMDPIFLQNVSIDVV